jgi:hypothetical protein
MYIQFPHLPVVRGIFIIALGVVVSGVFMGFFFFLLRFCGLIMADGLTFFRNFFGLASWYNL